MIDTTGSLWAIDFSKNISYNEHEINIQKQDLMTLHYFAKESIHNLSELKKIICKHSSCKHDCRLVFNFNNPEIIDKNFTEPYKLDKHGRGCSECYYYYDTNRKRQDECSVWVTTVCISGLWNVHSYVEARSQNIQYIARVIVFVNIV